MFFLVCQAFFQKFFLDEISNGEGGIWTLAPLLTTYSLSRRAPSATWVLLQGLTSWILSWWTERVGFEPTRPCGQTVFKTASLWPLRYPCTRAGDGNRTHVSSLEGWCSTIELHPQMIGTDFFSLSCWLPCLTDKMYSTGKPEKSQPLF